MGRETLEPIPKRGWGVWSELGRTDRPRVLDGLGLKTSQRSPFRTSYPSEGGRTRHRDGIVYFPEFPDLRKPFHDDCWSSVSPSLGYGHTPSVPSTHTPRTHSFDRSREEGDSAGDVLLYSSGPPVPTCLQRVFRPCCPHPTCPLRSEH